MSDTPITDKIIADADACPETRVVFLVKHLANQCKAFERSAALSHSVTPIEMHPDMVELVMELAEGKRRATADEWNSVLGFAVQHASRAIVRSTPTPYVLASEEQGAFREALKRSTTPVSSTAPANADYPITDAHLSHLNLPNGGKVGIPDVTVMLLRQLEWKLQRAEARLSARGEKTDGK